MDRGLLCMVPVTCDISLKPHTMQDLVCRFTEHERSLRGE